MCKNGNAKEKEERLYPGAMERRCLKESGEGKRKEVRRRRETEMKNGLLRRRKTTCTLEKAQNDVRKEAPRSVFGNSRDIYCHAYWTSR